MTVSPRIQSQSWAVGLGRDSVGRKAGERAGDRRVGTFPSVSSHSLSICEARPSAAAVFEFTILRDGKLGGVGGGDAISDLHAVPFLHLGQRAHQSGVGRIQRHDPFFL